MCGGNSEYSGAGAIVLNSLNECPKRQLVFTSECLTISQPCGTSNVTYFTLNSLFTHVLDGFVTVKNTGSSCVIHAYISDAQGAPNPPLEVAPGASVKQYVEGLALIKVACGDSDAAARCTGEIILELRECVTCN